MNQHLRNELHRLEHRGSRGSGYLSPREREAGDDGENREACFYGVNIGATLAAAATQSQPVSIDNMSMFELEQITGYAEPNGIAAPIPDVAPQLTVQFAIGSANRTLFNIELPWGAVVGSAKFPMVLPCKFLLLPNQSMTITVRNFSAIQYNNIWVVLIGTKIYLKKV